MEKEKSPARAVPDSPWMFFLRGFRKNKLAVGGSIIIGALFFVAVFAQLLSPYDPLAIDTAVILHPPSGSHPMGTDELGRDVLSRILWGARVSLLVLCLTV